MTKHELMTALVEFYTANNLYNNMLECKRLGALTLNGKLELDNYWTNFLNKYKEPDNAD